MRKVFVIVVLTIATMTAFTSDAFAQRRGGWGGGRGSSGSNWGVTIGGGGISVGSGYYGGYSSPYYSRYGSPYYYGNRYYSTPYYYSEPSYYYESAPIVQVPATEYRQSFYSEPAVSQQVATMVVLLPRADAQVWFDGAPTTQQGMERTFNSPPLISGGTYTYTIRARWMENGQSIERERRVNVQPGQVVNVDFRGESGERLQAPPRSQ